MTDRIAVEVAYALPDKQRIVRFEVEAGTTAFEAVERSNIAAQFDDLVVDAGISLGLFGKAVKHDYTLRAGDRIEIYRPLLIDPKEVRKARAKRVKAKRTDADA